MSKEGINQKYHRSSSDVRFWTSQHAFSSFALLTPKKKFGMQGQEVAFWSENVGFFRVTNCSELVFLCTSTRALSFGLIYLQTMRQACCWQADMFGVTCHPVLLQVLLYHHDVLHIFTVCLIKFKHCLSNICFVSVFVNQSVLPPFSYIKKKKKSR